MAEQTQGTLAFYNHTKGYGFIDTPRGRIHIGKKVVGDRAHELFEGAKLIVRFSVNGKGPTVTEIIEITQPNKPTLHGEVIFFNTKKRFGFLKTSDGHEYFIHSSRVPTGVELHSGTQCLFTLEDDPAGRGMRVCQLLRPTAPGVRQQRPNGKKARKKAVKKNWTRSRKKETHAGSNTVH